MVNENALYLHYCMIKLTSIVVAFLILVQSFNIHFDDVVELDDLIEHAQFHSDQYGDNFIVFLSKHYGTQKTEHNQKHQEEKQDHERLPFQHQCQTVVLSAFVLNTVKIENSDPLFTSLHKQPNFFYSANYFSLEKETPFQPPRLA